MDGDFSPLEEILDLAEKYDCMTYLDEIHAIGIYGVGGCGVASARNLADRVDVIQAGFGRGLGGAGGYIATTRSIVDLVKTLALQYVFSTAAPACVAVGNRAL